MTLYTRMAAQNLKNNYRFFVPRVLTEAGLLACFYITLTLARDERMRSVKGGAYLPSFMAIGAAVIALLSVILMLYTNSFLMKQRKREFGLYNVLGMEKRHVGKVLLRESLFSSASGIALGLLLGMLFYKLCSLLICRLMGFSSVLGFYYIRPDSVLSSVLGFAVIDLMTYLVNLAAIARMKPVELLASAHTGEKEPKVRWLMLIVGLGCLALGYYFAISTKEPLRAIIRFFEAVFLVIIGTYFLFVTGTTFVLQKLRHNERYYYQKKHFTAVSGLLYRMKQNAVGLASICILAMGVLVMISTTVSLYAGTEQTLGRNYPQEMYLSASYETRDGQTVPIPAEALGDITRVAAEQNGTAVREISRQEYLAVAYAFENGVCVTDRDLGSWTNVAYFVFMTQDAYRYMTGEALGLQGNEIAFCVISEGRGGAGYSRDTVTIGDTAYRIAARLTAYPYSTAFISSLDRYGVVVSGESVLDRIDREQRAAYGRNCSERTDRLCVSFTDRKAACAAGEEIERAVARGVAAYTEARPDRTENAAFTVQADTLWTATADYYGMYGTFLFLGILLGIVCLFATALIIYYKQISEGYEDRERYQIMEKVGMSQKEVKESIRSQVLLIFFLPLAAAGVHVCFAFPMLTRLLKLLLLSETGLFVLCTAVTFLVFTLVYVAIYAVTAKTYYKIVH